jgi:hypothetical protein
MLIHVGMRTFIIDEGPALFDEGPALILSFDHSIFEAHVTPGVT